MNVTPEDDFLDSRKILLMNNDLKMGLSKPRKSMDYFYKNAECDELLFVHEGKGILKTFVGDLEFVTGDYLIIPRGTIYQVELQTENTVFFVLESHSPIYTPKRYRNEFGQLLEHSPFCERDIIAPTFKEPKDEKGEFLIKVKKRKPDHRLCLCNASFLMLWAGTVISILINLTSKILNPLQEEFTNRRRFTRILRPITL